jgi:hypothetical protein
MTEPELAVAGDRDPLDPIRSDEGAVGAARVLEQPVVLLLAQHGMLPRHARVSDHDVRIRVTPDPVTGPGLEYPVRPLSPHAKRLVTRREGWLDLHLPSLW